jgi:hypothetical protein
MMTSELRDVLKSNSNYEWCSDQESLREVLVDLREVADALELDFAEALAWWGSSGVARKGLDNREERGGADLSAQTGQRRAAGRGNAQQSPPHCNASPRNPLFTLLNVLPHCKPQAVGRPGRDTPC